VITAAGVVDAKLGNSPLGNTCDVLGDVDAPIGAGVGAVGDGTATGLANDSGVLMMVGKAGRTGGGGAGSGKTIGGGDRLLALLIAGAGRTGAGAAGSGKTTGGFGGLLLFTNGAGRSGTGGGGGFLLCASVTPAADSPAIINDEITSRCEKAGRFLLRMSFPLPHRHVLPRTPRRL